jgi:DNA-binding NarL/FixJ family response regulator
VPERAQVHKDNLLRMPDTLTLRERQIAEHLSDGATVREIANELYLTRSTVQRHICKLRRKFAA